MPQFNPSQSKTARVPVTVQPSGLSCEVELFLGPNDASKVASSGRTPFVSAGSQQQVGLPMVMPNIAGTYHVYIDLYVGGSYFAGYTGTEDVVIAVPGVDVVAGYFTIHNINGIPFSSVSMDIWHVYYVLPYAVLAQPLVISSLGGLSVNFTYQGYQDISGDLYCEIRWEPDFIVDWDVTPPFAAPFFSQYTTVPFMSNSPMTKTVTINNLSNSPYGAPPPGNWLAYIRLIVPGGGPGVEFLVRGITLQ